MSSLSDSFKLLSVGHRGLGFADRTFLRSSDAVYLKAAVSKEGNFMTIKEQGRDLS